MISSPRSYCQTRYDARVVAFFVCSAALSIHRVECFADPSDATMLNKIVLAAQRKPLTQLDLQTIFTGHSTRFLGFTNQGTIVLLDLKDWRTNTGNIVHWDVRRKKIISKAPLSKWLHSFLLTLSPDGKWLATSENSSDPSFGYPEAHRATVISSTSLKIVRVRNVGARNSVTGFLFPLNDNQNVVVGMDSLIPSGNDFTYGRNRLEWLSLTTGRTGKALPYFAANEIDKLTFSMDKRYLAGLFYSAPFNPYGESDYTPLRGQLDRQGFVDIINPTTGKILWHIEPSNKQPVGDPLFFISPTRFISSDTVFNIATKTARPWNAITPTRKCLAAVPNHPNTALFLTPSGLQLRDWQKDKLLASWPTVKQPGRIMFSPDLKMFSFKRGSIIQFWKFNPKWLK